MDWMHIYRHCIILKKGLDGYSLKGGRSIQLGTLTNCSIRGAENSTDASDVHYMADVDEDAYSRLVVDQMSDKELFLLKTFGIPDLSSGALVGVLCTQAEDSKSMQFAAGRGGASSNSRLLWTRFSWAQMCAKWRTVFSPITFAAQQAHENWKQYMRDHLRPYCREHFPNVIAELVPFAKSKLCPAVVALKDQYLAVHKWMKSNRKKAMLQVSDWCCAESIRVKPPEPLHLTLRISIIVLKWYFLYTLEYCKWIDEPENHRFKYINHSNCSDYQVHSSQQIVHHFRDCLGIPLSYDKDHPGKTSIAANGAWRRKLFTHLEDAVICEHCGFRPWKGSPVETYFLLLFINLIEALVPIELLHHDMYRQYFERYLKQKFIDEMDGVSMQTASVWMIYAQHFYALFMMLLGPHRMTRYIHGFVFCTHYGFELAYSLKSTYRALFGADVVERMHSVTKSVLHTSSSRFGGPNPENDCLAERTMTQIMKCLCWDRYDFREQSLKLNLHHRLKNTLWPNHRKKDAFHMNMANKMRRRCLEKGYKLKINCALSNEYQRLRTCARLKQTPDIIHFYSTQLVGDLQLIHDPEDERLQNELSALLNNFDSHQDALQVTTESALYRDWDDDEDDDYDFDESQLQTKFKNVVCVALQYVDSESKEDEKQRELDIVEDSASNTAIIADSPSNTAIIADSASNTAIIADSASNTAIIADSASNTAIIADSASNAAIPNNISRQQMDDNTVQRINIRDSSTVANVDGDQSDFPPLLHRCSDEHIFVSTVTDQVDIRWQPLNVVSSKNNWNFSTNMIRWKTCLKSDDGNGTLVYYRMTWKYPTLRFISHHQQGKHVSIWMKFSVPPLIQRKEQKDWIELTQEQAVPQKLSGLMNNGKLSIWMDDVDVEYDEVMLLIQKFRYFTSQHQINLEKYAAVAIGFSDDERIDAINAFKGSKNPVMRAHDLLCIEIEDVFKHIRCRGSRVCLGCGQRHLILGGHCICMSKRGEEFADIEAGNVTRHIWERLHLEDGSSKITVQFTPDPTDKRIRTQACCVIQGDCELWGALIWNIYVGFVEYILAYKRRSLFDCVEDRSWKQLVISGKNFVRLLNGAMIQSLRTNKRKLSDFGDQQDIIASMVTAVSDLFIMPRYFDQKAGSLEKSSRLETRKRLKLWRHKNFNLRLRKHFRLGETATHAAFIHIFSSYGDEISTEAEAWTFLRRLK